MGVVSLGFRKTGISVGQPTACKCAVGCSMGWLCARGRIRCKRHARRSAADDQECLGMDSQRLWAISRIYSRSVQRIFRAMVWATLQGPARRLLGDTVAAYPEHLA